MNHDFLPDGWEGTGKELKNGIFTLLEKNGLQIEDLRDVTAGLSGIDTRLDQQRIETCMKKIGVPDFAVCNDGFLPVMAECRMAGVSRIIAGPASAARELMKKRTA